MPISELIQLAKNAHNPEAQAAMLSCRVWERAIAQLS
jgi:hypothetical protein